MGSGFRTFASGEVLTAANVNNYLMEQAVMSFADGTARDAAITSPEEGMTAYLQDTNSITVYSGSAWVTIADLEVLIVDSTNGRVGVGTSSPDNPISIVTSNTLGNTFTGTTDGEGLRVNQSTYTADDYVSLVEGSYADGNPPSVRIGAQYTSGGSRLSFGTTNSYASGITNEALTIDQSGYVGIGTVDPERTLEIHGASNPEVRLRSTDSSDPFLYFGDQVDAVRGGIGYDVSEDALLLRGYNNNTRMTIDSSGKIGIGAASPADLLDVGDGSTTGSFRVHAGSGSESFRVASTIVRSASIVATTTGTAANVFINAGNNTLYMSTSSLKYKTDVETMEDAYADAILELRPVWYRSLSADDPDTWSYWGFIAEEVAEIDPRLVTFTVPADYERQYDEDGEPINPDVEDLTEPDGVQYDRLVPHLVNLLSRQRDQIADLTARIEALENT